MKACQKVCVLMSTYNGEQYIAQQLESILNQKDVEVYIIISDDGSCDKTVSIIRDYQKKYLDKIELVEGENAGVQKSFSKLINMAKDKPFDYFAFADQDDKWLNEKLITAVNILKDKSFDLPQLYFSNLCAADDKLNELGNIYSANSVIMQKKGALTRNFAYGCTCVFNKKAVEMYAKNYNARMWMHDYWLYLICLYIGEVYYDNTSYILYRQHSNNTVGYKHGITQIIRRKLKSFSLLREHPRENMAVDLYNTFEKELSDDDKVILKNFFSYRRNIFSRIKAAFDKDYLIYGKLQNIFLRIRFIIGAV